MKRILLIALCGSLAACAGGDHEDLKRWMAENTKDQKAQFGVAVQTDADAIRDALYRQAFGPDDLFQYKALALARQAGVSIDYQIGDLTVWTPPPAIYELVGLIYLHLPSAVRQRLRTSMSAPSWR